MSNSKYYISCVYKVDSINEIGTMDMKLHKLAKRTNGDGGFYSKTNERDITFGNYSTRVAADNAKKIIKKEFGRKVKVVVNQYFPLF
jgi:hypothetical protein